MANTTNFGWETPDDTDLVKDGALAMRTLGNAIDTSLVDLKGGTTGQVLSKNTNTDMDFVWSTPNVGDITEVQAGTGISVASGTGPIPVVTNTVATAFDAKGDLIAGTGADTFSKLTVGANNTVLTADSSTATGLKWAAASSGALTKISSTTFSNVGSQDIDNVFTSTYNTYLVIIKDFYSLTAADDVQIQMRYSTTTQNTGYYGARDTVAAAGTSTITGSNATAIMTISDTAGGSGSKGSGFFYVDFPDGGGNSSFALVYGKYYNANSAAFCDFGYDTGSAQTFTGFRIKTNNNDFYGTVIVYGLEK